jgi:hypothetical protein
LVTKEQEIVMYCFNLLLTAGRYVTHGLVGQVGQTGGKYLSQRFLTSVSDSLGLDANGICCWLDERDMGLLAPEPL